MDHESWIAIGGPGEEVGLTASAASVEICVRIQHHPSRAGLPRRLIQHLGAFEDVEVIPDPEPNGILDAWRAHRACLESISEGATHMLLLQDDALPVQRFGSYLCDAVEQEPKAVLCAFAPGFKYIALEMTRATRARVSFAPLRVGAFVPCVAIVYPREFIVGLLDWIDHRSSDRQKTRLRGADDGVLAIYCRQKRIEPLLIVPSIVEHDETLQSVGKTHRRPGPHRRAALLQKADVISDVAVRPV